MNNNVRKKRNDFKFLLGDFVNLIIKTTNKFRLLVPQKLYYIV